MLRQCCALQAARQTRVVVLDSFCKHCLELCQSIAGGQGAMGEVSKEYRSDWKERCWAKKGRERPGIRKGQADLLNSQYVE